MYLLFSWRTLNVPCKVRNAQLISRIYSSQKILTKSQVTKFQDQSIQEKSNELIQVKDENKYVHLKNNLTSISPEIHIGHLNIFDKSKKSNEKWREIQLDISKLGNYYLKLSKFRLTSLVVITSMIGYAMAPSSFDTLSFLSCTLGTGLVSSAANSVNQFLEVPFDAQMSRTRNRVLVQGRLSPLHAIGFATVSGSLGLLILHCGANSFTAALGFSNLILYTMIYTPLKRISILNTWIGSIVGAIPPLMGWAACQGSLDVGAFILGSILFAWQFPHFNSLSWNLRPDYSKAGYRMMAVTNPGLCRRTALKYTLGIIVCSSLAPVFNVTHWSFGVLSLPINVYFTYLGFKFYQNSDSKNSRKLFRFSLIHLPLLLGLMLVTKQGLFFPSLQSENLEETLVKESDSSRYVRQLNAAETEQFTSSKVFQVSA